MSLNQPPQKLQQQQQQQQLFHEERIMMRFDDKNLLDLKKNFSNEYSGILNFKTSNTSDEEDSTENAQLNNEDNGDDEDDCDLNGNNEVISSSSSSSCLILKHKYKDIICHICNNKLNEPKLLDCLHSFCKNCLNEVYAASNTNLLSAGTTVSSLSPAGSLTGSSTNGGYLNDDNYGQNFNSQFNQIQHNHVSSSSSSTTSTNQSISCRICHQETKITQSGVDGLEDNHVMLNMLDELAIEEKTVSCTSCKAKDKAVARCTDCSNFLCPNCVTAHQYMRCFENHRVVKFDDMKNNRMTIHKPLNCKIHEKETLKYFCTSCDVPICTDCIVSLHQVPAHSYERLSDVEKKNQEAINSLVTNARNKLDNYQVHLVSLENFLNELQEQLETARGSIDETYQSYKAILEKRRDDMLNELEDTRKKKELRIMDIHHIIENSVNKINDAITFSERLLKNGNNAEISLFKKYISNQIDHVSRSIPEVNINADLEFVSDRSRFEKAVFENFGHFANNLDLQQQQQQQQYYQQQQQVPLKLVPSSSSFHYGNHDDNLHQSPSSTEPAWPIRMNLNNQKPLINSLNDFGLNGHYVTQSPPSPSGQDWLSNIAGLPKSRTNGLMPFDEPNLHSPDSQTAEWLMNMIPKTNAGNNMLLNNLANVQNQFQPHSPIETLNFINSHSNQLSNVNSRSQTPGIIGSGPTGNNLEDYMNFNTTSMTQNLNQLSKLIAPHGNTNATVPPIAPISMPAESPPLSITSDQKTITAANQAFAGNGNLNPPVRNIQMSHMQVRHKFGQLGPAKGQFNSPHGFCLGPDEEIVIADTNNHRIQIHDKDGTFKYNFGIPGREEGQLWYPRKVTVMRATGKFVVCDRGNERSRMQIFNKSGHFIKKIAIRYIDIVAGLAITNTGNIVAVDSVSPTVFCISEAGDLLKWFDCSDHMREPSDIAISGNEYFVCDFKGHCVVVFSEEGNFLRRIGGENITNFPNGIDVSDAGDVLVGDSHGNRFHVAVFSRDGTILSEFECPYVKVSRCCGLKITSEGLVVTLAKNNHHVLVLNTLYLS